LRSTPGIACPQPEPNATELPSCAPISARAAQRRRRRRWWRGEEGARRPGPEGYVLRHVLWHATSRSSATSCAASFTCSSFMCHLRAGAGGGSRPGRRAPQNTFFITTEVRVHVPKRAAQPLFGPWGCQRGLGPTAAPPAAAGRPTHEHPTWAPGGRYWSPPGSIRAIQSSQGCAFMCPSEPRGLWSGPGATGKVLGRSSCPVALKSHTHATAVCAGSGPSRIRQSPPSYLLLFRSRGRRKSPSPTAASKPPAFGPQAAHVLHTLDHRHSRWNGRRLSQPWP